MRCNLVWPPPIGGDITMALQLCGRGPSEVLSAIILTLALFELKYVLYVGYAPSYKYPLKQCSVLLGFDQFCYMGVHGSGEGLSA